MRFLYDGVCRSNPCCETVKRGKNVDLVLYQRSIVLLITCFYLQKLRRRVFIVSKSFFQMITLYHVSITMYTHFRQESYIYHHHSSTTHRPSNIYHIQPIQHHHHHHHTLSRNALYALDIDALADDQINRSQPQTLYAQALSLSLTRQSSPLVHIVQRPFALTSLLTKKMHRTRALEGFH